MTIELKVDKGQFKGSCNRTACQKPNAQWYNKATQKYYCFECAIILNESNASDAQRWYGTPLCVPPRHPDHPQYQKPQTIILEGQLPPDQAVHPHNNFEGYESFNHGEYLSVRLSDDRTPIYIDVMSAIEDSNEHELFHSLMGKSIRVTIEVL